MERFGRVGHRTGVTRYHQLYTLLAQALAERAIAPGSPLPTELELMRLYQVSRNTVRRALARLEKEGRIVRRRGSGTFAREAPGSEAGSIGQLTNALWDLRRFGEVTRTRLLEFAWVDTPAGVAAAAPELAPRCLMIERTRIFAGRCVSLATSYVPERIGRLLGRRRLGNKVVLVVLKELGFEAAIGQQTVAAVVADSRVAGLLDVPTGTPLVLIRALVRDAAGGPLEYQQTLYRPDVNPVQLQLHYDCSGTGIRWQAVPVVSVASDRSATAAPAERDRRGAR